MFEQLRQFYSKDYYYEKKEEDRRREGEWKENLWPVTTLNPVFCLLSLTLVEEPSSEVSSHAALIFTIKQTYNSYHNNNSIHEEHYDTKEKLIIASFEIGNKSVAAFYSPPPHPRNSELEHHTAVYVVSGNHIYTCVCVYI